MNPSAGPAKSSKRVLRLSVSQRSNMTYAAFPYRVMAVPLYTPAEGRGPRDELAMVAVIEPIKVKAPRKAGEVNAVTLFSW